jgi:tetratricopeptide (TPR) repeat protein
MNKSLVALGVLVLSAVSAFGQVGPASRNGQYDIRGKLIFANSKQPEDRIEVVLERNMQRINSVFTDGFGNFEFRSVQPGDYYIVVKLADYEDINQSVSVYAMQQSTTVSIAMNPLFTVVRKRTPGFAGDDPDVVDVSTMLKSYPKRAVQEYEKGLEENKKGATDKAISHFEEAIRIAPDFYHALNNLGVDYVKVAKYDDAEAAYQRAREVNPKAQQPALNMGILYITEADLHRSEGRELYGDYLDKAMDCLDVAIRLNPRSAAAHYFLGTAYYKSEFYEEAEASLNRAWDLDPTFYKTRIMLVNVYTRQLRLKEALQQIDAFLRENPKAEERPSMESLRQKIVRSLAAAPIR